jgi:hypothetical protein
MNDCIEWPHGKTGPGYGSVTIAGKQRSVHRLVFFLANGYYPPVVRHKCDNPCCYNVDHLLGGTAKDNVMDSVTRGRWNKPKGSSHYLSRMTQAQVDDARRRFADGERAFVLAKEYGYALRSIYNVLDGTTFKN